MKTVGIVADNYKLEKFKKELTSKGFTDFTIKPYALETSLIQIKVLESKINDVKNICTFVELYFKRSN